MISFTTFRHSLMMRPKFWASLPENLSMESAVSSIIRVKSSDWPSSKVMAVCRLGLIQTRPWRLRSKSCRAGM